MGRCSLVSSQTCEHCLQHWALFSHAQPSCCKKNPEKWCKWWAPARVSGTIRPQRYGFTGSALQQPQFSHQIHSPSISQLSTSIENFTYSVYSAFFDRTNTPDKTSTASQHKISARILKSLLSFSLPCRLLKALCSMFSTDLHFRLLKPWITAVLQSSHHKFHTDWCSLCCHYCCSKILPPPHHLLMLKRWEKPIPKSKYKLSMFLLPHRIWKEPRGAAACESSLKLRRKIGKM